MNDQEKKPQKKKFAMRLKQKWVEYRSQDPSGFSFLCYCFKYLFIKTFRVCRGTSQAFLARQHIDTNKLIFAVRITGGLGDAIIHRRVLQQIALRCPDTDFFLFCPVVKQGKWVFRNMPGIRNIFPLELFSFYEDSFVDVSLHLNTFAFFNVKKVNWKKVMQYAPELVDIFSVNAKRREPWEVFIDNHPTLDGAFARQAVALGLNRYTVLPYMLGIDPPPMELDLPMETTLAEKIQKNFPLYLTINTGFDAFFIIVGRRATKCYPEVYWEKLVSLLKEKYPSLGIIQIGDRTSPHIRGVDQDLVGKTTLEECAGILKGSTLHIDIEGGLVHVCASIGTRCVTLFGPTSLDYFGYPQNIKLRDNTCPDCWWSTERWMERCPRNYPQAECMYRLMPEKILEEASPVLDKALS